MNTESCTFEQGNIRPPDEADSLLIRTTRGCPWNRCHYCTLFKGEKFSIRSVDDIKKDIRQAKEFYGGAPFETCFLQDGDSFTMKTRDLLEVLKELKESFPSLKKISSYGRAQTMGRKSPAELQEIYDAGLNMLYCGIESGSNKVLELVRKGVTGRELVDSSVKAREAGISLVVFVILGLGGKELSDLHISETANVLNQINPYNIRLMSLAVKNETGLNELIANGSFTMLSETEMVAEQRSLLEQLHDIDSRFGSYHGVNLLTEVAGILPNDKNKMMGTIDNFLGLSADKKMNFIMGRRLGYYHQLSDLGNSFAYDNVQKQVDKVSQGNIETVDSVFHDLRNRFI